MSPIRIPIKVVPGASRTQIAGWLGDALKVRVSEPPEKGKANKAVCKLVAGKLGLSADSVQVVGGSTSARKVIEIEGVSASEFEAAFPK
ncbi:DUF167 domain-containing protein [Mariniblastus fucicola]|uniref:UPF0235 protein MFFC18_27640 n=1 Tax=Mariniblastus fucicola TaxID=980251 RepID=A0A5B9P858_9BACT|nr:DUF167 domain-containing protein [Mariniblastus fucicola]QEG22877.1 hypothetical protein MFFC18_27640 [Mariniblastus fucicola]